MQCDNPDEAFQKEMSLVRSQERNMKRIWFLISISILIVFALACSSSHSAGGSPGTSLQGTWAITGNLQCTPSCGSPSGSYHVALVSSPCTVTSPVGMFSVDGSVCFIANNNTAQGSISGTGLLSNASNTGQGVLVGVPANPVPDNSTINLLFVAGDKNGNFVEFAGTSTIANGTMQGTLSCSANTSQCQGTSATFSGTQQ